MYGTNPNGANQYVMDPRQKLCWDLYINPDSDTFSNGLQSALRAGYEYGTAIQITTIPWFREKCRKSNLIKKAENNLEKLLDSDNENIQADMTKFTLETLDRKNYSKRKEFTGKDGEDLMPKPIIDVPTNRSDKEDTTAQ